MSTEELICRGYELARKHGLKITAHIAGGTFSLEKGFLKYLRETGRTDVRYLMQLGILDPQWILIHGIHVTELDIEQMARVGCSFVYTPTSEVDPRRRHLARSPTRTAPASMWRSAPTARWSTTRSTWSSR